MAGALGSFRAAQDVGISTPSYSGGYGPATGSFRAAQEVGGGTESPFLKPLIGNLVEGVNAGLSTYKNIVDIRQQAKSYKTGLEGSPELASIRTSDAVASPSGAAMFGNINLSTVALIFGGLFLLGALAK